MAQFNLHLKLEHDASILKNFYSGVDAMDTFIHTRLSISLIESFKEDVYYRHPLFLSVKAYCTQEYSAVGFYSKCRFLASEFISQQIDSLRMYKTLS